jgi:hypothetical protein
VAQILAFSEARARSCLTEFLTLETSPKGWHHAILRQFLVAAVPKLLPREQEACFHDRDGIRQMKAGLCPQFDRHTWLSLMQLETSRSHPIDGKVQ